jgi:hypothetical protein
MRVVRGAAAGRDATLRRLRAGLIPAAIAAAVAVASGCGGDGDGGQLSAEEFRRQANAICEKYNERIQAIDSPSSPEDLDTYVEKVVPVMQQGIDELRALHPPAESADDFDRMLDETEKAIPAARQLGEAAANNDAAAVQRALKAGQQADDASDEIATDLGLTGCASSE